MWFPGLVPIRIGSLTVDPVTGVLAPVVGARLDMSRKTIVPVTVSNWTTTCEHIDTVQVGTVPAAKFDTCFNNVPFCYLIHALLLCDTGLCNLLSRWRLCKGRCF